MFHPLASLAALFDRIQRLWEKPAAERCMGFALIWIYLLTIGAVELKRLGFYPLWLPQPPASHYFSIQLAFTLILGMELISLIFILPESLSKSMAKQLEILTLILLRNAFKELALLPEPVDLGISNLSTVIDIAASGAGALSVFLCLGFYKRLIKRQNFLQDRALLEHYVLSKKILSLCMLVIFICIASHDFWIFLNGGQTEFFETIYTVLIFADIAMVLIAQRYMPSYYAVFRNSGYVIGTLMMRLSQSAPPLLCVAIAVFSGLYVLALTWSASLFMPGGNG